jgi:hypothetical protein
MRLVPDHGEELVLTRKAFQVRDSWLAELKGTEADGPGWPARPLDHGWTLWITPEGVLSAPECGLPAGRNGRRETPNTTGSLASRVDRPARGTPTLSSTKLSFDRFGETGSPEKSQGTSGSIARQAALSPCRVSRPAVFSSRTSGTREGFANKGGGVCPRVPQPASTEQTPCNRWRPGDELGSSRHSPSTCPRTSKATRPGTRGNGIAGRMVRGRRRDVGASTRPRDAGHAQSHAQSAGGRR